MFFILTYLTLLSIYKYPNVNILSSDFEVGIVFTGYLTFLCFLINNSSQICIFVAQTKFIFPNNDVISFQNRFRATRLSDG